MVLEVPGSMGVLRATMDFNEKLQETVYTSVDKILNGNNEVPEDLRSLLDRIGDADESEGFLEYDTPYLEDVLQLEISLMAASGTRLKRCLSCGRFFPVSQESSLYCNIPDNDGSSCLIRYRTKQMKESVNAIYTQAYRTRFARMKAGKETKETLNEWRNTAKRMKGDVFSGKLSPEEYKHVIMRMP